MQSSASTPVNVELDCDRPLTELQSPFESQPYTIVLQPGNSLPIESHEFQLELYRALENATDAVVVDLLWIDGLSNQAIAILSNGIKKALILGKALSFQSMSSAARQALQREWHHHRASFLGTWNNCFAGELEQFLDYYAKPIAPEPVPQPAAYFTADVERTILQAKPCTHKPA
jgi:anti-anti-sigma regulatory factor